MNIFQALYNQSRYFYLFVLSLGVINSTVYLGLLIFINNAISPASTILAGEHNWVLYAGLVGISLVCTKLFQTYMVRITHNVLFTYELEIIQKLRQATYQAFEKLGAQRVYTSIGDVRILGHIPEVLVAVINSTVIIFCAIGYLFYASPKGGILVLCFMATLLLFYLFRNKRIEKDLNQVRDLQNGYHKYLRDLLYGFKEIKMGIIRSESIYLDYIKKNRYTGKELGEKSAMRYLDNELTGTYGWYVALGVVMFAIPKILGIGIAQTAPFVMIILFLMGPLASLIKIIPYYTNVKIALERINEIQLEVNAEVTKECSPAVLSEINVSFKSLEFKDVVFTYFDEKSNKTFKVGPINLEIEKGEVIFITGGNGSGKSTFINLLTGLYQPSSGQIYFNGFEITPAHYSYYSNKISAIFTNNYLFSENYDGFELKKENEELKELIDMMKLSEVLKIDDERKFIDTGLSKGQQKRLSMIYAILEQREIVVLDEWAAEQDPVFRAFFYNYLVPHLKQSGKTIIAVTHDDYYFSQADRKLKFDYGKIVEDNKLLSKRDLELKYV